MGLRGCERRVQIMKSRLNLVKKLTVGVFAIGILVAGIAITPKQAEAEDTITIKVIKRR